MTRTLHPGPVARALANLMVSHDLPDTPPPSPLPLLLAWFEDARARGAYADFNAMTLATADASGAPSARIVLCKAIEESPPAIVFYTSYESRKGRELESNPRAAALFHWPHAKRQARVEGVVERVSDAESDAYFRTRPLLSRIGACVSLQSSPIDTNAALVAAALERAKSAALAGEIERPPHWGGYRVHMRAVELWSAREGRLHDRIQWTRIGDANPVAPARWTATRLSA